MHSHACFWEEIIQRSPMTQLCPTFMALRQAQELRILVARRNFSRNFSALKPVKPFFFSSPQHDECTQLLTSQAFSDCHSRLNLEMYVNACMQDKCACQEAEDAFCLCSTISEYSRQCSHAGGRPRNWRTEKLCRKQFQRIYWATSSLWMKPCKIFKNAPPFYILVISYLSPPLSFVQQLDIMFQLKALNFLHELKRDQHLLFKK